MLHITNIQQIFYKVDPGSFNCPVKKKNNLIAIRLIMSVLGDIYVVCNITVDEILELIGIVSLVTWDKNVVFILTIFILLLF